MKLGQSLAFPGLAPSRQHRPTGVLPAPRSPVRSLVVPHGIAAVPRTSPVPLRKKTPWRRDAGGACVVDRAGGREWFGEGLFVESKPKHLTAACWTSIGFHAAVVAVIVVVLVSRAVPVPLVKTAVSLRMPSILSLPPASIAPPAAGRSIATPAPTPPAALPSAAPVPAAVPAAVEPLTATMEPPPAADPVSPPADPIAASEGGAPGGVAGGVGDGLGGLAGSGLAAAAVVAPPAAGPLRAGGDIDRPRKIKDVKPVYPANALARDARGTVIVDLVVGINGRVTDATIRQSVPALDQAALDAVRQWEFEPARKNGEAVAVIVTAVVSFAIL